MAAVPPRRKSRAAGFTLFETAVVLVVMGLLLGAGMLLLGYLGEVGVLAGSVVEDLADTACDVEHAVRTAVPHTAIMQYVRERDVDLIAMGTHGRTGVERYLLGSVAEYVQAAAAAGTFPGPGTAAPHCTRPPHSAWPRARAFSAPGPPGPPAAHRPVDSVQAHRPCLSGAVFPGENVSGLRQ